MNSLEVVQYNSIKTAIQATATTIGDFSINWSEPVRKDVARELDLQGFQVDEDMCRVSWRDPAYPTRENLCLLASDRAFISSFMSILEAICSGSQERFSNDSFYSKFSVKPNLPSGAIQLLRVYYVDWIAKEKSFSDSSSYFVSWKKTIPIYDKYTLYMTIADQYEDMFIPTM